MIDRIKGICIRKSPTEIVIDVGGIGFLLAVPLSSYEKLDGKGKEVSLLTYLHVREDILQLYGFATVAERDLFVKLIGISGVGPKMGLAILSRFSPNDLYNVVANNDIKLFTTVKGIGKRTAERLMVELRSRIDVSFEQDALPAAGEMSSTREAVSALEALGYSIQQADDAVRSALKKIGDTAPVEDLVRTALKG